MLRMALEGLSSESDRSWEILFENRVLLLLRLNLVFI
jgi:hypothetical protein